MKNYLKISLALSIFGFLKEFRPSEPFLADYYSNFENITIEVVNHEIFPVGTYSHVVQLIIIFLVTDYLRYKPLIVLLGISGTILWGLMLFVKGKLGLQVVEVFYGFFCAAEIAYFSYIYAKIDKKDLYQIVTSHTRAALFFGKFLSAVLSQFLVYYSLSNYRQLNSITFVCQFVSAIWAIFFIPSVKTSVYFHQKGEDDYLRKIPLSTAFKLIWKHFTISFSNSEVILWSIFYSITFCLYFQAFAYIQVLWIEIEKKVLWNATVDAILCILSAFGALLAGKIEISFLQHKKPTIIVLTIMSIVQGILLLFCALSPTLLQCYILFVIYGVFHAFSITICATKIAETIIEDSFGLVFGFNTFIALVIQTILTAAIVSNGLLLDIRGQYVVYSGISVLLGVFYLFAYMKCIWKNG